MSGAALPFSAPPPIKGERAGLLAALALHVALLGALSLRWGTPPAPPPPEPEPITVSLVKDVAPTATAPPARTPPAPSVAPDQGEPEDAAPPPAPAPKPEPVKPALKPEPKPAPPKPEPKPAPVKAEPKPEPVKAEPKPKPAPVKPAPAEKPKAEKATAAKPVEKPAPAKAEKPAAKAAARPSRLAGLGQELAAGAKADATHTRGHKLGADFLSGLAADAPAKKASAAAPAAKAGPFPTASIQGAIQRQIQPCADRQVVPGPGANEIVTVLNIRLNEDGTLAATPHIVRQSGLSDENNRYAQRVADLGVAAFKGCTPLHLPAEYYQTAGGAGWNNINYRWQLK